MFQELMNIALNIVRSLANSFGYEIKVILTDHEIKLKFASPEEKAVCWEEDHYVKGNVFLDGYANAIKPELSDIEDKYDMIASERYKSYMKNSLIEDIMRASKDSGVTKEQGFLMLALLQAVTIGAVIII